MLTNGKYDKIKIVYVLSKLSWFLKQCALPEAKKQGHAECAAAYENLIKDLDRHVDDFYKMICK